MVNSIKLITNNIISSRAIKVATRVVFLLAPQLILIAIGVYDQVVHAQGLVGGPGDASADDPRYGQSDEASQLGDFGYDAALDICRGVTALSAILSSTIGLKVASRQLGTGKSAMNIVKGLAIALGIPSLCYLSGTFVINNIGGLGGE